MRLSEYLKKKVNQFDAEIVSRVTADELKKDGVNIIPFRSSKIMATREEAKDVAEGKYDTYNIVEKGIEKLFD